MKIRAVCAVMLGLVPVLGLETGCTAAVGSNSDLVGGNQAASCEVPTGPYGVSEGTTWQDWTVTDCAGNPTSLYNNSYCSAEATVYIRMQGWCGNCQAEAPTLMEELIAPYEARGIRFIQVIQEDEDYNPVDGEFCSHWADVNGLGNHVFMDPDRHTSRLVLTPGVPYTQGALPIIKVVDADGVIRADLSGDPEHWVHVKAALDEILGN